MLTLPPLRPILILLLPRTVRIATMDHMHVRFSATMYLASVVLNPTRLNPRSFSKNRTNTSLLFMCPSRTLPRGLVSFSSSFAYAVPRRQMVIMMAVFNAVCVVRTLIIYGAYLDTFVYSPSLHRRRHRCETVRAERRNRMRLNPIECVKVRFAPIAY